MALGQVEVNNLNLGQGGIPEIERHFLFIGTTSKSALQGKVTRIDATTDLAPLMGNDALGDNVKAAQVNGGQNWTAEVFGLNGAIDWEEAVDLANASGSFEAVVLVDETTDKLAFKTMQAKTAELINKLGRWCFFLAAVPGIDASAQTWSEYETATIALQASIAANMVVAVPQLHGNNAGVLAGRLCNRSVTVADTPMRVATGPVLDLGASPKDKDGNALSLATLGALSRERLSVPQWYADYEGIYWADASTLEAKGGDYQFLEYIRPVHKLNRRVRIQAIRRVGDKILNSTPASIELNKQYFSRYMREMSKGIQLGDIQFPGEIMPPKEGDVTIQWLTKTKVAIGLIVTPHNCPKHIVVNIALDLSNQAEG
ncbi:MULTISPECIES: DUF2586 domain-containing protein [Grimontia]|uniref:Phage tail sheath protein n=1 Tax=Grimontia marina TaxID=646534 RepID=A0A128F9M0_9GAMM|nr:MULTISPECIES: DUF2586 domain-containing protein [Grimontia]WRV96517.1 DUF2586 domain-containing protein [Grimontia sp. NTOU-MAR1]CZF83200.1 hypothetical protein GMA8713_02521 [Grimontia marina]